MSGVFQTGSDTGLSDSQFYMWRALFALVHADNVVTNEEVRFMAETLEDLPLSPEQKVILEKDAREAQDIEAMFLKVTVPKDQAVFFKIAKTIAHIDGDYGAEEQGVILKLKERHLKSVNLDDLIGTVELEFEDSEGPSHPSNVGMVDFKESLSSFQKRFMKRLFER